MTTGIDVRHRLADPRLLDRLRSLGFRPDDAADAAQAAVEVLSRPDDLELIATLADRLVTHLGDFTPSVTRTSGPAYPGTPMAYCPCSLWSPPPRTSPPGTPAAASPPTSPPPP